MAETTTSKPNTPVIDNVEQASSNFYWVYSTTSGEFNMQTTIRGILSAEQIQEHIKSLLSANAEIVKLGGQAKGGKPLPETQAIPTVPISTSAEAVIAEVQKDVIPASEPTPESFMTETLVVNISNNKKYFKIKGGPWSKYGITIWDEVLVEAGIPVGKLEGQDYKLPNYKAYYVRKADGKPDKVTKLEKVA